MVATDGGGEDEGDAELTVWFTAGFVPLVAGFPAAFTSVSARSGSKNKTK